MTYLPLRIRLVGHTLNAFFCSLESLFVVKLQRSSEALSVMALFCSFQLGLDGKGFEPTLEALFGEKGFFPDTASKALYWVDGRVPEQVSRALFDYFGYSQDGKQDQVQLENIICAVQHSYIYSVITAFTCLVYMSFLLFWYARMEIFNAI